MHLLSFSSSFENELSKSNKKMQTNPVIQPWGLTVLYCKAVIGHLTPVSHLWHYWERQSVWAAVELPPLSHYQYSVVVCVP